ncbi:hypothetical protein BPNPMPFG_007178 (plasmid) [Mesorhizobium sp. AR07]|uniref:hypothetical protein n=1 Tax=Mesorhizobium sp. AR07 TaxID=2865838 RepID=UPI00215EB6E1|nr:hypothetical protein [Mesorhizobium sp. AR07]UVK48719.1 hypothetical protein BPNPMPFG_007178 [Mesorhizobium sp. AR07]
MKRDLQIILRAGIAREIPVIISSAGGANPHLMRHRIADRLDRAKDAIASEDKLRLRFATIDSELDREAIEAAFNQARISSCGGSPELTERDIKESEHIVAQLAFTRSWRDPRLNRHALRASGRTMW